MNKRTITEERAACLRLARFFLEGDSATVSAASLATFLFEIREAASHFHDVVDYEDAE